MARPLDAAARARLQRRLAAIPERLKAAAREALTEAAPAIVREIKSGVPVDDGDLHESVQWRDVSDEESPAKIRITAGGERTTKRLRNTGKATSPTYDYAAAIEFGTRHAPAQPFFYPAVRRERKRVRSKVQRAITKAAKEI